METKLYSPNPIGYINNSMRSPVTDVYYTQMKRGASTFGVEAGLSQIMYRLETLSRVVYPIHATLFDQIKTPLIDV